MCGGVWLRRSSREESDNPGVANDNMYMGSLSSPASAVTRLVLPHPGFPTYIIYINDRIIKE
jgi:hypothetical protein